MKNVLSEITTQRLLALTRAALLGTDPDEKLFINAVEADWTELFELSVVQGVMVLSLNGSLRLPKDIQPPFNLKLRWIASAETVEKRYRHSLETAEKLYANFKENNIRMMLFKGLSLSRLYPVPYSREFGDIDIFLCGKSKEGDAVLKNLACKNPNSSKKNTNFNYRGILIENHYTFLNHVKYYSFHNSEILENRLLSILNKAGFIGDAELVESYQKDESLLFPPPDFNALYVILHLITHLSSKIVLRYLCDITILFTAYKGKIDFSLYQDALSDAGLFKIASAIISLSVRYLGLNPNDAPPYESDLSLENRIWNDMLNPEIPPFPKEKRNLINIFIHKIRLLRSNYWKYELVFPGKFRKRILHSIFFHISKPKTIGKLR